MKEFRYFVLILACLAIACNLGSAISPTEEPAATVPPAQVDPTATVQLEPTEPVVLAEEVCLPAEQGMVQFKSEAGGYCFLLPETFEASQSSSLDTFATGPTLETFGMHALVLIAEFNVLGAPGGAGELDAQIWGARVAEENALPDYELRIEPFVFESTGLEGVRVGIIPGLIGGESVFLRENDTLYGITVYPDRESYPDYTAQVDELWSNISTTTRFFTPVDTGAKYRTERDVCPDEQPDSNLVINLQEGWCALVPASWQQDTDFSFPGRYYGGPEIGEFWPGQPPYANIVIGFSGPTSDEFTLQQQVEGRMSANGRPDLVEATETTLGGYPAAILLTQDGPHPERLALIHTDNYQYSVIGQPFDGDRFPDAQDELEAAWQLVIDTIQFFEPYR